MFTIPWGSVIFQIVAFLLLMFFLKRVALKPLMGIMKKREQLVNEQIDSAAKNQKEADALIAKQREELEKARVEAQEVIQQAKKLSEQQGQEILTQAKDNAERMKDSAIAEIQREKEQAVAALREQVATISVMIATKVIEKELDEKEQEKYVEQLLKDVEVGGKL